MSMTGMQTDFTETDLDTLLFFDQYPAALPLYSAFEKKLCRLFPDYLLSSTCFCMCLFSAGEAEGRTAGSLSGYNTRAPVLIAV